MKQTREWEREGERASGSYFAGSRGEPKWEVQTRSSASAPSAATAAVLLLPP